MNRCMARLVIRIIEKCDSDWRCNDWLGLISGWMVFLDCLIGYQLMGMIGYLLLSCFPVAGNVVVTGLIFYPFFGMGQPLGLYEEM